MMSEVLIHASFDVFLHYKVDHAHRKATLLVFQYSEVSAFGQLSTLGRVIVEQKPLIQVVTPFQCTSLKLNY